MKITEELFEIGKMQKVTCTVIDEDYVLLSKKMPCKDSELDNYISTINKANFSGINISPIIDYRLIQDIKYEYYDQNSITTRTKGVFIEEKAKGNQLPIFSGFCKNKDEFKEYFKVCDMYIEELSKRANAPQEVFNKLISDYISLDKLGISPDPNPSNFFFDEKIGYTIIDVWNIKMTFDEYFLKNIFNIIFSKGLPRFNYVDRILTDKQYIKYEDACKKIIAKVVAAARKHNINNQNIIDNVLLANSACYLNLKIIEERELEDYINCEIKRVLK